MVQGKDGALDQDGGSRDGKICPGAKNWQGLLTGGMWGLRERKEGRVTPHT